jgi:hypothetical protein
MRTAEGKHRATPVERINTAFLRILDAVADNPGSPPLSDARQLSGYTHGPRRHAGAAPNSGVWSPVHIS